MVLSTIEQVEYNNTRDGAIIHVFGRTPSGDATHLQVTGFRPYFYIPAEYVDRGPVVQQITVDHEHKFKSIHGEALRRVYVRSPSDMRMLRDRYHHFEADIPFTSRFLIDSGITGGVESPDTEFVDYRDLIPAEVEAPARICIADIECSDDNGWPEAKRDPIISLTAWDSFDDAYFSFVLLPSHERELNADLEKIEALNKGNREVVTFVDEKEMLEAFVDYIHDKNPDILTGWNFILFDLPYLLDRMRALKINPSGLSRLEGFTSDRNDIIRGRCIFDLLEGYKKTHLQKKESYRLDAIAENELGDHKLHFNSPIGQLWREDPATLVEYNWKDVEICKRIEEKCGIVAFHRELARYVGCDLQRTINSSSIIDIYILRKANGRYVLPSKGFSSAKKFEGATVFDPSLGLKSNIIVLDLKALYPMSMMTVNASPETKDPDGELRAPNGVRFKRYPDGLTRSILSELLNERDAKKALRQKYPFNSPEYKTYDMQQNVLKVIMNTYYGVSGYSRFRLYDRDIGAAVTSIGRGIIEHTKQVVESMGYKVIYGDTDANFIELGPMSREETIRIAKDIERALNASYNDYAKTLGADDHFFSIKFEKIYERFFQAGKKKRYAGRLVWKEGKEVDEIDIVGFELKRSDSPPLTKTVQQFIMDTILKSDNPYEEIKNYLGDVITKYRRGEYSLDEIGIPGGISKDLREYEIQDSHIRGALYANQYLGANFGKGSKPRRIYVKSVIKNYPRTDVICYEYSASVPREFVPDYDVMLEKTIQGPITRIIEALNWSWSDMDPEHRTLAQFSNKED